MLSGYSNHRLTVAPSSLALGFGMMVVPGQGSAVDSAMKAWMASRTAQQVKTRASIGSVRQAEVVLDVQRERLARVGAAFGFDEDRLVDRHDDDARRGDPGGSFCQG